MDPITVTGLLGSTIQVANLGLSTISWCHKVYKDGRDYHEISDASQRFHTAVTAIEKALSPFKESTNLDPAEQALYDCAKDCAATARTLVFELAKYDICEDKGRLKQLFVVGLRRLCKTSKVDALRDQLETHKKALDTSLLVDIRQRIRHVDSDQLVRLRQEGGVPLDILRQISGSQRDLQSLSIAGFSEIARQVQELHIKICDTANYEQIMKSLFFPQMSLRLEEVSDAHRKTFEWIWDPSLRENLQYDFMHWLQYESGIFWISGKLGSGKSTLMKFIHGHDRTAELLSAWAEPSICCRSAFFLWNNGQHALQKSICGLLQTIFYNVLTEIPSAVDSLDSFTSGNIPTWSEQRLMNSIKSVMKHSKRSFFIMIDGLDELEGNTQDLINCVRELSRAGAKLCVSGRPWNEFERVFTGPSLRLHDLTKADISRFVSDRIDSCLQDDPLLNAVPHDLRNLKTLIETRAEGVFLWAKVVTDICATSIVNGEDLEDLYDRISILPMEMRELFSRITERIKRQDPEKGRTYIARYFSLLDTPQGPISLLTLSHIPLTAKKMNSRTGSIEPHEVVSLCLKARIQLRARCGGLIQVGDSDQDLRAVVADPTDFEWLNFFDSFSHSLRFVHRTAEDFLNEELVASDLQYPAEDQWDPLTALSEAYVNVTGFMAKHLIGLIDAGRIVRGGRIQGLCAGRMQMHLIYAAESLKAAEIKYHRSHVKLVDRIFEGATEMFNALAQIPFQISGIDSEDISVSRREFFGGVVTQPIELSAYWRFNSSLQTQIKENRVCPSRLLYRAASGLRWRQRDHVEGLRKIHACPDGKLPSTHLWWLSLCELLVGLGANPNAQAVELAASPADFTAQYPWTALDPQDESSWVILLRMMTSYWGCDGRDILQETFYSMWMRTFNVLIDQGNADVNATITLDALEDLCKTSFNPATEYIHRRSGYRPTTCAISKALWVEVSPLSMLKLFFRGEYSLKLQEVLTNRGGRHRCHLSTWVGLATGQEVFAMDGLDIALTESCLWNLCYRIFDQEQDEVFIAEYNDGRPPAVRPLITPAELENVDDAINAIGDRIDEGAREWRQLKAPKWLQPPTVRHEDEEGKDPGQA